MCVVLAVKRDSASASFDTLLALEVCALGALTVSVLLSLFFPSHLAAVKAFKQEVFYAS